jgi:hypothetical protein
VTFCEIIRRGDMRAPVAVQARPTRWSAGAVRDRLIEAADIDRRMTGIKRPRPTGNAHLQFTHTHEDRAEWEGCDIDVDSFKPTPSDRAKAEKIFAWLRLFTAAETHMHHALKGWINAASVRRDFTLSAAATKALEILTGRLNETAVPAF